LVTLLGLLGLLRLLLLRLLRLLLRLLLAGERGIKRALAETVKRVLGLGQRHGGRELGKGRSRRCLALKVSGSDHAAGAVLLLFLRHVGGGGSRDGHGVVGTLTRGEETRFFMFERT
jgi:hypothetical protein